MVEMSTISLLMSYRQHSSSLNQSPLPESLTVIR